MARGKFSFHNILVFLTVAVALCAGAAVFVSGSVDSATCDTEGVWSLGARTMGGAVNNEADLRSALAIDIPVIDFGNDIVLDAPIEITRNVTINGGNFKLYGKEVGFTGPVISIDSSSVTINNLTITGGKNAGLFGGGIYVNSATLTVAECEIIDNEPTGIDAYGSSFLTIQYSTIADNKGNGVYLEDSAKAQIMNSTIARNQSGSVGVGILIANEESSADVFFSTITGHLAGIHCGNLRITASILVNNSIDIFPSEGETDFGMYGVFGGVYGNETNYDNATYQQVFGPNNLDKNGGNTRSIALANGSPAIGLVPNGFQPFNYWTINRDQRHDTTNYPRPGKGKTMKDSGAYETQSSPTPTPPPPPPPPVSPDVSPDVKVTGVSLNKSSTIIRTGATETLSVTIQPPNAKNKSVTWSSNNGAIATVSDGNVTGVANGNATITVKTDDGGFTADCAVLVSTDAPVSADPVLNPRTLNLIEDESGTIVSDSDGTWQTGDNSIINMEASARSVAVTAKKLGKATITFTRTSDKKMAEANVFVEAKAVKEVNDKLKSDDVGINILSPDLFTSVDARIEPTAPTMVCYEPSGKPAGVIEVDISDTVKYPDVNNVFLPMQYTLGLSEAEIKKNCENVGREINMGRLFSKDGTPDSDIIDEFFRVFVIQKEILQGARKGQLARLLGQGKDQIITPGDAIRSDILSLTVSVAEKKVYLEFRYFVKDGDMSPVFNGKDLIIGDGLGDRLIVDPMWTSTRSASSGPAPDGGGGCNSGWGFVVLILISYPIYRGRKFLAIFLVIFAFAGVAFAAESVGVIEDSVPQSWAVRGGSTNPLRTGDEIFVSDTIATDEAGKIDIQFADGTTIALGPNSEAVIKDFVMSDTKNNFEAGVLKGAARVVTGGLVKRNPNGFKVTTPRSTIGIRGTTLTFGVDKRGNEIVSVTDIGDNSHVTIISQSGKRHTVNTLGHSYFAPIGREGAVIKNNDAINRMVEELIDVADTGVAVEELLKDVFEEVERQVVEQGVAPTPAAPPGDTGTETTKKEVNVVADVRPSPRNIGNCE